MKGYDFFILVRKHCTHVEISFVLNNSIFMHRISADCCLAPLPLEPGSNIHRGLYSSIERTDWSNMRLHLVL